MAMKGHFQIGDRVRMKLLLRENEGRIGRIIGIRKELPTIYYVRFAGPHPDIGCVWDYYFDEIEGVDSWLRI